MEDMEDTSDMASMSWWGGGPPAATATGAAAVTPRASASVHGAQARESAADDAAGCIGGRFANNGKQRVRSKSTYNEARARAGLSNAASATAKAIVNASLTQRHASVVGPGEAEVRDGIAVDLL